MAKGFFERTGNVKKLKEILDNLPEGTVITKRELSRLSGATTKTITNVLARDYPNPKFIVPDAATAQAMTVKKNVEKKMQNVKTPSPITTNRKITGVRWPSDNIESSYIDDLRKKYSFPKGTVPELSNKAFALKYFGKSGSGEIAKVERINNFLVKDLNLSFAKGSPRKTYLRRKARIDESKKFLSDPEKIILNKQNSQKKIVNSFFKNNPEAINDPKYKKVKDLMNARFKDGKITFDVRDDAYYIKKAKEGKLFDLFDISAVASEKRNIRFPSNLNVTPGQFNQAFIKQITTHFAKNPDDTTALNEVSNFLKSYGIRAEVPGIGRIGEAPIAAVESSSGRLPNIENTFEKLGISELMSKDYVPPKKINEFVKKVKSVPGGCRVVVTRALGGPIDACEAIIKANPKAAAIKLNNAITATKGPLKELKEDSKKLANFIDTGQITTADKLPRPDDAKLADTFKETNIRWNNDIGAFVTPNEDIASQADIKKYAADNPIEVKAGETPLKPATNKSVLANVGRTMAAVGAPLPTALIDSYFIGQQVKQGKGTAEIASNPLNWLGLATMEPLTKAAGIAEGDGLKKVLRLGLNPATIRGISRFAGLPGLAISTAMTAYDQYEKYKDGEGFIYKLFNKEGT